MKAVPNLEAIKISILRDLEAAPVVLRGMFLKNWPRYRTSVGYVVAALPDPADRRLLDYGCGHPFVSRMLADLGYGVVSYEPFATESEWQTARWLGVAPQYCTELPPDALFDLVLMIDVIEHLAVIKPIMLEINRLTLPGGQLVISTPNVMRLEMWLRFVRRQTGHPQTLRHFLESDNHFTHHQREFTQAELCQTIRHFGFQVVRSECISTRDRQALEDYRLLLGDPKTQPSLKGQVYTKLVDMLIDWFPNALANNLFLAGKKIVAL